MFAYAILKNHIFATRWHAKVKQKNKNLFMQNTQEWLSGRVVLLSV